MSWILWLLGEAAARRDPRDASEAEGFYHQAAALADARGMRPLLARCHLGLGTLHRQAGSIAQARAELSPAADLFRSMEMALWLTRAEDELTKAPAG